jgi:hypothetical protein
MSYDGPGQRIETTEGRQLTRFSSFSWEEERPMAPCLELTREMLISPVSLEVLCPDLTYSMAREIADAKALAINPEAMLLAWFDRKTGQYSPKVE